MTLSQSSHYYLLLLIVSGAGACSGLVAGPESRSVTPIPASRDSAYARVRRALQGESFTLDVVDSARAVSLAPAGPARARSKARPRLATSTFPSRSRGITTSQK